MTAGKRSKHLVVQDNPFREKSVRDKALTPTQKSPTTSSDNDAYRKEQSKKLEDELRTPGLGYYENFSNKEGQKITFKLAHGNTDVSFYAFVDSLSESYTTNFQQTEKMGSPESVYQYNSTSKTLSLSWKAFEDDYEDLPSRIEKLKKLVYPDIDEDGVPTRPPMVLLNYGPLREDYSSNAKDAKKGVFGYIASLSIDYSSQELGHDDEYRPRLVTFQVSFQPINRGKVGNNV